MKNALIFANGELNDGPAVRQAMARPALIMAADGGADLALSAGFIPTVIMGDMDSIQPKTLENLEKNGAEIFRFSHAKDENDLELVLLEAAQRDFDWIRVIGAVGGRLDQTIANVYLLNLPELVNCDIKLVAGAQTISLLRPGEHRLEGEIGDTISLIPLAGDVTDILTDGLRYPLRGETLVFGPARGISNVIVAPEPKVRFVGGLLMLVHTIGHA